MDKLLYRVSEACELLGVSRSKLYLLIASGELPTVRVGGTQRVRASDLRDYAAGLRNVR